MCPSEEAEAFRLDALDEEISTLEKTLSQDNQLIGFCHNDLQYGNIMIDEQTKSITIIVIFFLCWKLFYFLRLFLHPSLNACMCVDGEGQVIMGVSQVFRLVVLFSPKWLPFLWQDYEYSSYNTVAYDMANHFCEMAADYHTETPHILDYTKYPGGWLMELICLLFHSLNCFTWSRIIMFWTLLCVNKFSLDFIGYRFGGAPKIPAYLSELFR